MSHSIIRFPALRDRYGISRSRLYVWMAEGKFPRPIRLGERSVGWLENEVEDWLRGRVESSRQETRIA
ncbi:MAG: AlpA family transcriptional regulator [Edaphobacter sp.]|nr:AlpA family transcriptional regulator [Edaphobacter sp.]